MNKKHYVGIVALFAILGVPVASKIFGSAEARIVQIDTARERVVRASTLASGSLSYAEQAQLSPELIGKVLQVLVKEGDQVGAGQAVLLIDDRTLRAEVAQQEAAVRMQNLKIQQQAAALAHRERQYARAQTLAESGFVTRTSFDDAQYAVQLAQLQLNESRESLDQGIAGLHQAREQLSKTVVRAPAAGTVIAVNIKVGETAVPSSIGIAGSSLLTIANTDTLLADVNVDESDIAGIRIGQQVEIRAAAFPDLIMRGEIETIPISPKRDALAGAAMGSSQARSYTVKVRLQPTSGIVLRPGMSCRAEIFSSTVPRAMTVPIQAVLSAEPDEESDRSARAKSADLAAEHHVFVLRDGHAYKRSVKLGVSDDSVQEIVSGLKRGERVVIGPYKDLRYLLEGEAVTAGAERPS
jgi:HlyD family secretion protein